jgi:hypothetical protein
LKPNSNWIFFLDYYFIIHLDFELISKRKVVHFEFIYSQGMFGNFWIIGCGTFAFCKPGLVEILEKVF